MAAKRGLQNLFSHGAISLQPAPPARMELELAPAPETVASFVHTRSSEQSWARFNKRMADGDGAMFWIGGPGGCGKTHFLNYVIALDARAPSLESSALRHLTCGFELVGRTLASEMETNVLDVLADALGVTRAQASLWREVRGESAIMVAMEQARRIGVRALTLAIDFGLTEVEPAAPYFATLRDVVTSCRLVKLTVIAAGRGTGPAGTDSLAVAPLDAAEAETVALATVRKLENRAENLAVEAYRGVELAGQSPCDIFPFHPAALELLGALAPQASPIAGAARLLREVLAGEMDDYAFGIDRLIYPSDALQHPTVARRADQILGEAAAASARAARDAAQRLDGNERMLAGQIVETLIAAQLCDPGAAVGLATLGRRVPMLAEQTGAWPEPAVAELLRRLDEASSGAIEFAGGGARFRPSAGGAPEVAQFNAALPLARRFVPDLDTVRDTAELSRAIARVRDAMANAVEAASRTRSALAGAMAEAHLELPPSHQRAIADFVSLAEGGPDFLIESAANPALRDSLARQISAYENLAAAAAVAPRMRAMREYLDATGLRVSFDEPPGRDPRVVSLETECQLLAAEIGPRALDGPPRNLDAVEARFQKFKWTYVQLYRGTHAAWRAEMERMAIAADDARRHLAALARLNAMTALGPAAGEELAPRLAEAAARVRRCDFEGTLAADEEPRCPRCGYVLGEQSPRAQLEELSDRLNRALDMKLSALSNSAIARIIHQHDHAHRLEGFLKIIQAAQTDALVRVLDDRLARYLARLLDENLAPANSGVVERLEPRRRRARAFTPPRRK